MSKNNQKFKKLRVGSATLAILAMLSPFTACNKQNETIPSKETQQQETESQSNKNNQTISLSQLQPHFSYKKWNGKYQLTIDKQTLYEVAKLALEDAKDFYQSLGAPNFKFDSNGNRVQGEENFYPDWFNVYYVLAQAEMESGDIYMIDKIAQIENPDGSIKPDGEQPHGIMQITPDTIAKDLTFYFSNYFNYDWSKYANIEIYPNQTDIENLKSENPAVVKNAEQNILTSVYNNVFTSIVYNIRVAKSHGPNHPDYYEKYGGFSNETYQEIVTALYLFKREDVINSLKNGTFKNEYANSVYVTKIKQFQKEAENEFGNQNQMQ